MKRLPATGSNGMETLKIGLVLDDSLDKPDGVQQYVLGIGKWLTAQGHEVHYLVGETKRHDLPRIHSLSRNVAVRFNGNRMSMPLPAKASALKRLLNQEHFDIVHVQVPYSPFLAARLIRLAPASTAVVGTFHILPHTRLVTYAARVLGWWLRPSLKRFDAMVSVSAAAQEFARRVMGIHSSVLPNVVDYPSFHAAKPLAQYDDTQKTVLFLGRLVPRKGCLVLLQAAQKLMQQPEGLPKFRLVICGKGPLGPELKRYATDNGLGSMVEFTGFVDDETKKRYYASADIAVFPSSGGESFGIVLLEAMASGKAAVLAGNNPGYASVMGDSSDLLFDPHSPNALAGKLRLLLTDEARRRSAAAWGEQHAKQYDTDTVGAALLTLYAQALHSRRNLP